MNLSFENHYVSNSPSKIEGAGGSMKTPSPGNHTPQSLRDSSSILEEQPDIQPFIFVELTLNYNSALLELVVNTHTKDLIAA